MIPVTTGIWVITWFLKGFPPVVFGFNWGFGTFVFCILFDIFMMSIGDTVEEIEKGNGYGK